MQIWKRWPREKNDWSKVTLRAGPPLAQKPQRLDPHCSTRPSALLVGWEMLAGEPVCSGPCTVSSAKPEAAKPVASLLCHPLWLLGRGGLEAGSSLNSCPDPDYPNFFPPDVKGNVLEGTGCVFLQNHLSHKMICILVGTQMSFPAHFLPGEKGSQHSFLLWRGGSCVCPATALGGDFLTAAGVGDQMLGPPAVVSKEAHFLTLPHTWARLGKRLLQPSQSAPLPPGAPHFALCYTFLG